MTRRDMEKKARDLVVWCGTVGGQYVPRAIEGKEEEDEEEEVERRVLQFCYHSSYKITDIMVS